MYGTLLLFGVLAAQAPASKFEIRGTVAGATVSVHYLGEQRAGFMYRSPSSRVVG